MPKRIGGFYRVGKVQMVSVTTALNIIDTGIGDWKAKVGAKEAGKISRESTGIGTKVHKLIDADIKGTVAEMPKKIPESVLTAFNAYKLWRSELKPTILESEKFVYSDIHSYAGTCDAIGSECVYDFKTSKKIHPIYWLQLAAYAAAIMEMAAKEGRAVTIKRLVVIRLDKELGTYTVEERLMSEDLLLSFLSTLRMWRFFNIIEKGEDNGDYASTIASFDIEPDRLRNDEEGSDKEVERPEVSDAWTGQVR